MVSTLDSALQAATVTREVVIQPDAVAALPAIARRCAPQARLMLVADASTWAAAGVRAQAELQSQGVDCAQPLLLEEQPRVKPREETARHIATQLRAQQAVPVAVGSGVINDLAKYAAGLAQVPYLCVATAASMDGYAASGAALLQDGFKRTLPCPPPVAVLADPEVLARAPARMAAWGYGDLAGKVVAGADWVLADALGIESINPQPFARVQDDLPAWLAQPKQLAAGDPQALAALMTGLLVSGFAIQAHGNSRPASGSDHQFSHLWEMEGLQVNGEPAAHGACVGVGCVAMLALYEWLLARPAGELARIVVADYDDDAALRREIEDTLGRGEVAAAATSEIAAKRAIGSRTARVRRFAACLPELRPALSKRLLAPADMQQRLRTLGAPAHPGDLGLSVARMAADYRRARLIRRRYTLLDLLEDLGWLDRAVADICGPGGFWM